MVAFNSIQLCLIQEHCQGHNCSVYSRILALNISTWYSLPDTVSICAEEVKPKLLILLPLLAVNRLLAPNFLPNGRIKMTLEKGLEEKGKSKEWYI